MPASSGHSFWCRFEVEMYWTDSLAQWKTVQAAGLGRSHFRCMHFWTTWVPVLVHKSPIGHRVSLR